MHQEVEDLLRVDAIHVNGGPKFDHCRGRPAILSIVSWTSGVFELIWVAPFFLKRKSQWLQPSASVWVRVSPPNRRGR